MLYGKQDGAVVSYNPHKPGRPSHAGQNKILLTITHEAATQIKALVTNVRHGLRLIQETAPQLDKPQRWFALVRYIVERILACTPKPSLGLTALATG